MLSIVVDTKYEPEISPNVKDTGDFELIYKEGNEAVNKRRDFSLDLCYPVLSLKPFIGKIERNLTLIPKKTVSASNKKMVSPKGFEKIELMESINIRSSKSIPTTLTT